ncbi:MAG: acyl-CoA dehydrogenase family protein [Deltaproteobacteria bacterium]|nr:acyl-CoA dehydrogenase family protein [Deltaproteobacteria bacterium]
MDFSLTKEQMMLMESLKDMAKREKFAELAVQINETGEFPNYLIEKFADMGLLGMTLSPEYGGEGEDLLTAVLAVELLAQFSPVIAGPVFESNLGAVKAIDLFGTEEQKKGIIPVVCKGELNVSAGLFEPETGADLTSIQTRVEDKEDYLLLNGKKTTIICGSESSHYLIYAVFEENMDQKQFGAVIAEKGMEGFLFGEEEKWMGLNGIPVRNLIFENVKISKENIVINKKFSDQIPDILGIEHCGYAAMCLGIAGGALEHARQHALQRVAFGHKICEFQAIQLMIADMAMNLDAARLLVYRAAVKAKQGMPSFYEAAAGKCLASKMVKEVTDMALQIFGGYGFSTEYPLERMVRDSRALAFLGGTQEMLKVSAAGTVFKGK